LSGLAEGKVDVKATATDPAGNQAHDTASSTLDVTGPSVDIEHFASDDGYINTAESTATPVSGTSSEKTVDLTFTDVNGKVVTVTGVTVVDGKWSTTADLSDLAEGKVDVKATATDPAGNQAHDTASSTLDVTGPTVDIEHFAGDDGYINTAESKATPVSGTSSEKTVDLTFTDVNGKVVTVTGVTVVDGKWSTTADLSDLAEGKVDVKATATDPAGNQAHDTASSTLDMTGPTVDIEHFAGDDGYINTSESKATPVSGTSSEKTVDLTFTDVNGKVVTVTGVSVVDGKWSTTADLSGLAEGKVDVKATATDPAGNQAHDTASSTLDVTGPSVDIEHFAGDDGYINTSESKATPVSGTSSEKSVDLVFTDASGKTVEVKNVTVVDGKWSTTADLSDLAEGKVDVKATATDPAGNQAHDTASSTLDVTGPSVDIEHFAGDDGYINTAESKATPVSGTSSEKTVDLTFTDVNGKAVTVTGVTVVDGKWSTTADLSDLAEGKVDVKATATDPAGNQAHDTASSTLDVTGPSVDIEHFAGDDGYINTSESKATPVSGTSSEKTVDLTFTDVNGKVVTVTGVTVVDGKWSTTADLSDLAEGKVDVKATATDPAGNQAHDTASSTLDVTGPSVDIEHFAGDDGYINTSESKATPVSGTSSEKSVDLVFTDASGKTVEVKNVTVVDGKWSTTADLSGLAEGKVDVKATATDPAGNQAHDTASSTLDMTGPSVDIEHFAGDDGYINTAESTATPVSGTSSEKTVDLTFTDVNGKVVTVTGVTVVDGKWSTTADLSDLAEGKVDVKATATDPAGNQAHDTASSTLDMTGPTVDIEHFAGDDGYINTSESKATPVSGTSSEKTVDLTFTDVNGKVVTVTGVSVVDGKWSTTADLSGLAEGKVDVKATATDPAGNQAHDTASSTLDVTGPSVDIEHFAGDDGYINTSESTATPVSGTSSEKTVDLTFTDVNGKVVTVTGVTVVDGKWSTTADLSGLAEGKVDVKATATDPAGNQAHDTASSTLDVTGPSVDIEHFAGDDGYINTAEAKATPVSGTSSEKTVDLTFTDVNGKVVTVTGVTVVDGKWSTTADLSDLAEGKVDVKATTTDPAGNQAHDTASSTLDVTGPSVDIEHFAGDDGYINTAESKATPVSGTSSEKTVDLTFT
ncbi:hypothetical protein J5224_24010, partial [Candidatus Symbiopectobacterium sp. NZEC135]|nr:hypothetical protein [Candidatus Symbiopectobacterium sp. NZEC135]